VRKREVPVYWEVAVYWEILGSCAVRVGKI
jgi:hypothetical protein